MIISFNDEIRSQSIYYKSDIKLLVRLRGWSQGERTPFKFVYQTDLGGAKREVSFDGTDFIGCSECEQGVEVNWDYPHFQPDSYR